MTKRLTACALALLLTLGHLIGMEVRAAEKTIRYKEQSPLATANDAVSLRRYIYNTWGEPVVKDIDLYSSRVSSYVTVDFTISGLWPGGRNWWYDENGVIQDEPYHAYLGGSIGGQSGDAPGQCGNPAVEFDRDGQYSVTWEIPEERCLITCLYLQTNINYFQYLPYDSTSLEDCKVDITIDRIYTDEGVIETVQDPTYYTYYEIEDRCGDVNEDGCIDILDVILLNKSLLGGAKLDGQGAKNADVDRSGTIDTTDALNVLKAVVRLITLPV